MADLLHVHRLRGREGRAAFEFDVQIGASVTVFYWRERDQAWLPMSAFGKSINAAQIAKAAGLSEDQAAAEIEAGGQMCEREYLRRDPPPLRAVA